MMCGLIAATWVDRPLYCTSYQMARLVPISDETIGAIFEPASTVIWPVAVPVVLPEVLLVVPPVVVLPVVVPVVVVLVVDVPTMVLVGFDAVVATVPPHPVSDRQDRIAALRTN